MHYYDGSMVSPYSLAVNNVSIQDGQHLETLAFLLGYSDNDNFIATDLIFPKQYGQAHKVDDEGIIMLHYDRCLKQ